MTEDAQQFVALDGAEITRRVEALLPEINRRADEIAERAGCRGTSSMR